MLHARVGVERVHFNCLLACNQQQQQQQWADGGGGCEVGGEGGEKLTIKWFYVMCQSAERSVLEALN